MAKKSSGSVGGTSSESPHPKKAADKLGTRPSSQAAARPSALVDTRVVYCGDNLEQLQKLPDACVNLVYI